MRLSRRSLAWVAWIGVSLTVGWFAAYATSAVLVNRPVEVAFAAMAETTVWMLLSPWALRWLSRRV